MSMRLGKNDIAIIQKSQDYKVWDDEVTSLKKRKAEIEGKLEQKSSLTPKEQKDLTAELEAINKKLNNHPGSIMAEAVEGFKEAQETDTARPKVSPSSIFAKFFDNED